MRKPEEEIDETNSEVGNSAHGLLLIGHSTTKYVCEGRERDHDDRRFFF